MFLHEFNQKHKGENLIFKPGKEPIMSALAHSYDNPHWSYPYHVHKDDTELIYFSSGKAKYSVNTEVYDVKKGDLLIVNHGSIHSVTSDPDSPISTWTCSIQGFEMNNAISPFYFLPLDKMPLMKAGRHEPLIQAIFSELEYYAKKDTMESTNICNALTFTLATIYSDIYKKAKANPVVKKQTFAQDILMYINEHYTQSITLEQLSKEFNISSYHISHKFQEVYGISPINYVIERRISSAKWLLINTVDTLLTISLQVGYENTNHFSKLFEKRTGYPPLEYRKRFKSKFNVEELDFEL
ncbi:MAG: AraC family transcriptional regulator [Bacillota bacterium]|nr:AraC family transcriptional regulator [Bacillota bacterium]